MSIHARARLPPFLARGRAATRVLDLRNDAGNVAEVTSATYTLKDSAGTVVLNALTATITSGVPSRAIAADFADAYALPQHPWREVWELTGIAGETPTDQPVELELHLWRTIPVRHVTLQDLYDLHSTWPRQVSQARQDPGSYIETAWVEMVRKLLGQGTAPSKILNWWSWAEVHKYWAASYICRDFRGDNPGEPLWKELQEEYWARAQEDYKEALAALDRDEDGVADAPGELESTEPPLLLTDLPAVGYELDSFGYGYGRYR